MSTSHATPRARSRPRPEDIPRDAPRAVPLDDLLRYLSGVAEMIHCHRPARPRDQHRRFTSYEALVLELGQPWEPAPLPKGVRRGQMKACYENAARLVARRPALRYVEGYAIPQIDDFRGIAVQHAWAVDPEGRVVDPTWPEPERSAYVGLVFPTQDLGRFCALTRQHGGILPGEYRLGCPLLTHGVLFPEAGP